MPLSPSYLPDLSRVRLNITGMNVDADYARVERTTDNVNWTVIRGGATVPLTAGVGHVDDYEFVAGALNTYRVTAVDSAPVTQFGVGTVATGNNVTLVPALPAGSIPTTGTVMLLFATHRSTSATIATPAGWTSIGVYANAAVFYRVYQSGDAAPSVVFSGGSAGDSCTAQIRAYTNATTPSVTLGLSNTSAQNVNYPASAIPADNVAVMFHWKPSISSGAVIPLAEYVDVRGAFNTAGSNNETHLTWYALPTSATRNLSSGTAIYTGGVAAVSRSQVVKIPRRLSTSVETTSITPVIDNVWVKNPSRPSQNIEVCVTDVSDITRPSRVGVFDVVGRTMPVAVTDVQGSRRLSITLTTTDLDSANAMDARLATGEPLFIQAPSPVHQVPTLYAVVGDITQSKRSFNTERRFFTLPLTEVAAPGSIVTGDTILWLDVTTTWSTWSDVLAAKTTWSNLIDSISSGNVLVP